MGGRRGRPRHWASALYARKRDAEGAKRGEIVEELIIYEPTEYYPDNRQVRRWINESETWREPTLKEVAKTFAFAEGFHGRPKAHDKGRLEFKAFL